jgi:hypothetical protein
VFTFNGRGQNATAIDATNGAVLGTIPLGGKPEFAQGNGMGLIYVNIETDTGQVVAIDTRTLKEVKRYWLPGCQEPSGLAFDRATARLFSVCGNAVMAVSDPATGKVVTMPPDRSRRGRRGVRSGNQAGLRVQRGRRHHDRRAAGKRRPLHRARKRPTKRGSRTMALDPRTHRVYLSSAEFGPAPAPAQPGGRPGRPPMIPGSFAILVLESSNRVEARY